MQTASHLKKTNICEYLLYMWQIEDLIRALKFDLQAISEHVIQPAISEAADRKLVYEWYESLIDMMRMEQVMEKGHLQINKNVIIELDDFHVRLMKSGKEPAYNGKFFHVLPLINQFRQKSEAGLSDIELCFSFQYGYLMLKLRKATITPETAATQTEISKFMVLLAKNYHAHENGMLDLE